MVADGIADAVRFTVLLPTHHRPDVLGFAIQSVLAQTERDFELLIVADGCTDNTAEVVGRFDDPRIRFFDLPKAPFFGYANRNVALREARGQYVAYAPHDNLMFPDHLERLGALLDQSGASLVYSRPVWVSRDGIAAPVFSNITFADAYAAFQQGNTIPSSCIAHRRDAMVRAGYWPEDVTGSGDWVLWKRIIADDGDRVLLLPEVTALHFSALWRESRHAQFPAFRHALDYIDRTGWWPAILKQPASPEISEQAHYSAAMTAGGRAWCAELRAALDSATARLSFEMLNDALPEIERLRLAVGAAESDARDVIAKLEAELRLQADVIARLESEMRLRAETVAKLETETQQQAERNRILSVSVDARDAEIAASRAEIVSYRTSTSWRITTFLRSPGARALRDLFGRLRR